ncbi:MAG TPA: phosphotransferase family protein [Actinomycetota bacterium]|nr:phosphotransferase family protein [Actinomycetota bacterium]
MSQTIGPSPSAPPDEPLVDEAGLARWLAEQFPDGGDLLVHRHQAGHSNETFFITWGDNEWVLRRPPRGAFLPTAHDVAREYRVLTALGSTDVRVPRTIAMCSDDSVIGVPFYLAERVHGDVIRTDLPERFGLEERARIGEELVDALVELHTVDPAACGLGDFGKPTGYLERQLRRWTGQMQLTLPLTRPLADLERIGEWLTGNLPETVQTTLVHGDYKLDNVMFAPSTPAQLLAILDWEMSTLGDPLADVGYMLVFWREPDDDADDLFGRLARVTELPGFRSRAELLERYETRSGRKVTNLSWYQVLAIWKLAILLEGSYARHLAGLTDDPFFAEMEHGVPRLAERALALIHP